MLKIDNDILLLIFEKLYDDNNSLFSCLLVNKQWCQMAVPILWSDPMKINFNEQLLDIIKHSLTDKSKTFLLSQGIEIIASSRLQKEPLFDYIKYCKYLRFDRFNEYANLATNSVNEDDYFLIEQEFFKLYISKCTSIKYINIELTERYYKISPNHQLCQFPGAENCFSELTEFHCDSNLDASIFYGFAEICKFIEKINVQQLCDNPGLIKLIMEQKNLKKFKYTASKFIKHKIDEFSGIGKALEKNAETLLHFKAMEDPYGNGYLYGNGFVPTIFSKFKNLEKLILFRLCYCFMQKELEQKLAIAAFPKLKVLHIQDASIHTVIKMIEKTKGCLFKIAIYDVECDKDYVNNPFQELIQSIHFHCPNLKFLRLEIKNDILVDFEKLLITCQQLEGLVIE